MLKKRVIAALPLVSGRVVQSIGFNRYLPVGTPEVCAEALNAWGADELMLLDIHASRQKRAPDMALVKRISNRIFMPLTYGGGIKNVDQMRELIHSGADKIAINTAALADPDLISKGAAILGNQCIVVSMDVKLAGGKYRVLDKDPVAWAKEAEKRGAGELHVNMMDRDGMKNGFDLVLLKEILAAVSIPVIWMGGAGHPSHFLDCFKAGAAAAAAGNFFQFTEHSVTLTKSFLLRNGIDVRLDTQASYAHTPFDEAGRPAKLDDESLREMRYTVIQKEVI